jgi:putative sigma-54 modulation protein
MQIRLRTSRVTLDAATKAEVEQRIEVALRRFAPRLRLVDLQVADENGDRGGIDKRCVVALHLTRGAPVHVEARAAEVAVAADVALERAARVLARRIERLRDFTPRSASGLAS